MLIHWFQKKVVMFNWKFNKVKKHGAHSLSTETNVNLMYPLLLTMAKVAQKKGQIIKVHKMLVDLIALGRKLKCYTSLS